MAEPRSPISPATSVALVSPHASNELPGGPCKALWVNDSSSVTVNVVAEDDTSAQSWTTSGPGILPVRAKAVRVSGTTATSILALY